VPLLTKCTDDEDLDVANERRRVANQQSTVNDILVLDRMTKVNQLNYNNTQISVETRLVGYPGN